MQEDCVPETEESTEEELAYKNTRVLQHNEDEVLYRNDATVGELRAVNRDVYPGLLEDPVCQQGNTSNHQEL